MLVPNPSPLKMRNVYPWVTLDKIRHTMGWTDKELAHSLELTEAKFRSLQNKGVIPSVHSIGALSQRVGLSFDAIMLGHIDYKILKDRVDGCLGTIPERFEISAFSKRRTSINLLTCIEDVYGWDVKKSLLDHFQMTELAFADPDKMISFQFPVEFTEFLVKRGYPKHIFHRMGVYSLITNKSGPLGSALSTFADPIELFECLAPILNQFCDKNCTYRLLEIDENQCLFEIKYSEEIKECLKTERPGNAFMCDIRAGILASITGYIDHGMCSVSEVECLHRGDTRCLFQVKFPIEVINN